MRGFCETRYRGPQTALQWYQSIREEVSIFTIYHTSNLKAILYKSHVTATRTTR